MHDSVITSYEVNFETKSLILYACNNVSNQTEQLIAYDVLAHSFENVLVSNIIFSIDELTINTFIKTNENQLINKKPYCWPTYYDTLQDLEAFLTQNFYKCIRISSSYGLCGWILAKSFKIIVKEKDSPAQ